MTAVVNTEALAHRAETLTDHGLNGVSLVFVELIPALNPTEAQLDVQFFNEHSLLLIESEIAGGTPPTEIFTLRGGSRLVGGESFGQVQVTSVTVHAPSVLRLTVAPIGDYSTYVLRVRFDDPSGNPLIDPLLDSIAFKFRPGCFNINCSKEFEPGETAPELPVIDYLARDFGSFKHLLIEAMRARVPGWQPTSEADFDQVILDLLAADGDELADFQDRAFNEAYFGRARKRVSLARHARLMDYHIHQGNQASTHLAVEVGTDLTLPRGFGVWSGDAWQEESAVIFATGADLACHSTLNRLFLHTFGGVHRALEKGSTHADVVSALNPNPTITQAEGLRDLFRGAAVEVVALEELLNPETGTPNGRDVQKRRLLRLLAGDAAAEVRFDPVAGHHFVRIHWRAADALSERFCFMGVGGGTSVSGLSAFFGNVVRADQGRPHQTVFRPAGTHLAATDEVPFERVDEANVEVTQWGAMCRLPSGPLAYRDTVPGGEAVTRTTLSIEVDGFSSAWSERSDLVESEAGDTHYVVETDELGRSTVRFGTDTNGRALPSDAVVTCRYQVGRGSRGNVGADALTGFEAGGLDIVGIHNPFDVINGREPEPAEEILRRAPLAYRERQLRAVTLDDYVRRAEELPQVSHAAAKYAWTGSWRSVRVAIDPAGTTLLDDATRRSVMKHLEAVRLMGEDVEVRGARYVPLDIKVTLCVHPDYWPEDLTAELLMELSNAHTADGRLGLFHPDAWSFGQALHGSQLLGRIMAVRGVERVVKVRLRRLNGRSGPTNTTIALSSVAFEDDADRVDVDDFEVIRVDNDPNHLEHGRIAFDVRGGRR